MRNNDRATQNSHSFVLFGMTLLFCSKKKVATRTATPSLCRVFILVPRAPRRPVAAPAPAPAPTPAGRSLGFALRRRCTRSHGRNSLVLSGVVVVVVVVVRMIIVIIVIALPAVPGFGRTLVRRHGAFRRKVRRRRRPDFDAAPVEHRPV